MAPPKAPRKGHTLPAAARGFPCFYRRQRLPRIITADPWAFLRHLGKRRLRDSARKVTAFLDQAHDFYSAATDARLSSRPLLYYYAFLNLAKVLLLHSNVPLPPALRHGISDPRANNKARLHFKTQEVELSRAAHDHSQLFPELVKALAIDPSCPQSGIFKVLDLLAQVPAVHRTYCAVVENEPTFCPVKHFTVWRDQANVWAVLEINRNDRDVDKSYRAATAHGTFSKEFHQVTSQTHESRCYESRPVQFQGRGRAIDAAIAKLAVRARACGVWALLARQGYLHYLNARPRETWLPQFCSAYAAMFYLGSITRYRPYDFDKMTDRYGWLVSEFLDIQPIQMLYLLSSYTVGTEVVVPYAKITAL